MVVNQSKVHPSIGVAIAGLGFGEAVHLPALRANKILQPVALWHPRRERVVEAAKKNGVQGYSDWEELLNSPKVNAVIIATPPAPRFQLALDALNAGKDLLLEKPVALSAEQIIKLQKLALKNKLSVAVDFEYRAVPLFMQLKRLLDQGSRDLREHTAWLDDFSL